MSYRRKITMLYHFIFSYNYLSVNTLRLRITFFCCIRFSCTTTRLIFLKKKVYISFGWCTIPFKKPWKDQFWMIRSSWDQETPSLLHVPLLRLFPPPPPTYDGVWTQIVLTALTAMMSENYSSKFRVHSIVRILELEYEEWSQKITFFGILELLEN